MSKYLLSVKTGTYTDRNGQEKGRYKQVGTIEENQKGEYARFDLVTLAGVCALELAKGNSEVLVSMFAPDNRQTNNPVNTNNTDNFDSDIPF